MPGAVCPHCGTELEVDFADCGREVECTACHTAFTMPLPVVRPVKRPLQNRRRRRRRDDIDEHSSPEELIDHAKCECSGPANSLLATGAITVFFGLGASVFGGMPAFGGPVCGRPLSGLSDEQTAVFFFFYGLYAILVGAYQCYAARQMQRARQYSICVFACVMALIPGVGPVIFGTLFGYLGLQKLRDPWVKKGFAANCPGYDPDAPA